MYHNDVSHWTVALMFARCTLYTAHRGGKNARTNTERVAVALGMFEAKKYAEAWAVARGPVRKSAPTQNANTLERKVKQCVARTRDGEYSRALAGLQSADILRLVAPMVAHKFNQASLWVTVASIADVILTNDPKAPVVIAIAKQKEDRPRHNDKENKKRPNDSH